MVSDIYDGSDSSGLDSDDLAIGPLFSAPAVHMDRRGTLAEAAGLMKRHGIGSVIVVEDGAPEGIVTERDVVVSTGLDPLLVSIESVMSAPVITIGKEASVSQAIEMMVENGIRRLVVMDGGTIVGMLTDRDLLELFPQILGLYTEMKHILVPRRIV